MSLNDLLAPYIFEKSYMGIQISEKELKIAEKMKKDSSFYDKIVLSIKINAIIFSDPNLDTNLFFDLFENCNKNFGDSRTSQNSNSNIESDTSRPRPRR